MKLVFCGTPAFAVPDPRVALSRPAIQSPLSSPSPTAPPAAAGTPRLRPSNCRPRPPASPSSSPKKSRTTPSSVLNSNPSAPTPSSSSPTAASFPAGCSTFRRSATSISTARCCRNTAAPRPSSGPSPTATPSPASPPCASTRASTPAHMLLAQPSPSPPTKPPPTSFPPFPTSARTSCSETLARLSAGILAPRRRTNPSHTRPHPHPRRRRHRLHPRPAENLRPLARLPALARRAHAPPRQKAHRPSHAAHRSPGCTYASARRAAHRAGNHLRCLRRFDLARTGRSPAGREAAHDRRRFSARSPAGDRCSPCIMTDRS